MALAQYTQIGSKTVFAQQHIAGDVVYVSYKTADGSIQTGVVSVGDNDWEVIYADGTIEVWNDKDFRLWWQ